MTKRWYELMEEHNRYSEKFMKTYEEYTRIPKDHFEEREAKIRELNMLNDIGDKILKELKQAS